MWQLLLGSFAAVPRELWWDNEAGIGRRGRLTDPVTLGLMRRVKAALDPDELFNPGKLVSLAPRKPSA